MARTEVYVHAGLVEAMPRQRHQRERIMRFICNLRDEPNHPGDFTDRDDTQRIRQIKIIGDHAITYWHDTPVNIVMVVDIRHADQ